VQVVLQQLLIGLTNGMVFALIALGYTMVYGILELINFAHGDLFMLASFLALTLVGLLGLETAGVFGLCAGVLSIVLACALFAAFVNVGVDRLVYRPLRNAPKLAPLVSAIGVSFIFQNVGLFWGGLPLAVFGGGTSAAAPKAFPNLVSTKNLLGPGSALTITPKDLLVIGSSLVVMALLYAFVRYSRLGKAMRATAQNPIAARLMGIDVDRVIGWTFAIGGALAGFAAVVYGFYINTINYQIGYQNGLYAFTAAVLGGIGSITGAMLGGLMLGVLESLAPTLLLAGYGIPSPNQLRDVIAFSVLVLVLIFRPYGLFGRPEGK
jgi:branched-chain amino acid transport system permease protein